MIKSMLPIVDSFEMARGQLQPTNQGEQKIDSAYQVHPTQDWPPSGA